MLKRDLLRKIPENGCISWVDVGEWPGMLDRACWQFCVRSAEALLTYGQFGC